jgi:hypothetical protein
MASVTSGVSAGVSAASSVVEVPLVDGSVVEASIEGSTSAGLSPGGASVLLNGGELADEVRVGAVPVLSSGFAGQEGTTGVCATGTGAGAGFFGAAAAAFFGAGALALSLDWFVRTMSAHVLAFGLSSAFSSAFSGAGALALAAGELAVESWPEPALPVLVRGLPFPS